MTASPDPALTALPIATGGEIWRELRQASREHRASLVAVVALGLCSAALGLVTPAALGRLVDLVEAGTADLGTVVVITAVIVGASIGSAAGMALTTVLAARVYQTVLAGLRERLVARAMDVPHSVVERAGTGDLISRASDDVAQVADAAPQVVPALTRSSFTIIATFAGMTALDWRYGAILALILPIYVLTLRWYLPTAPRVYRAERAAMSGRAQQMLESLRGCQTVLGFGLAERRHRRVTDASWGVVQHTLRARTVQNMFFGRLHLGQYIGMSGILIVGYFLIDAGHSTVGAATTAMLFFLRLSGPINQLLFVVDVVQSVLASLGRMVGVITLPASPDPARSGSTASRPASAVSAAPAPAPASASDPSTAPAVSATPSTPTSASSVSPASATPATAPASASSAVSATPTSTSHAVRLHGVSFSYDAGRPALEDIDLVIAHGERLAVVGASGAGKTTLAGVIAGAHVPQTGTVERPLDIAVITQETHVFTGTLRDNLTLGAPDATDDDLLAALDTTGAAVLLDLLPKGLDTRIGATGRSLTAAQAQQVALARVVLADPELAIFDEATAEAGSTHAGILDHAADAALRGRTGLVIAHRLSQAVACDRIVVMDHGRIIEEGSHGALVAAGGVYARLWNAWNGSPSPSPPRPVPATRLLRRSDDTDER